ncbi:MAG: hypothetical protein FWH04_08375 [Oscillospiraceae bacterium]|nr:hypothetical protein [Oscillospiraceae bacterium]
MGEKKNINESRTVKESKAQRQSRRGSGTMSSGDFAKNAVGVHPAPTKEPAMPDEVYYNRMSLED